MMKIICESRVTYTVRINYRENRGLNWPKTREGIEKGNDEVITTQNAMTKVHVHLDTSQSWNEDAVLFKGGW